MANGSQRHAGSAVVTFLVHALLWPVAIAILIILAAAAKLGLEKGAGEVGSFLNVRTAAATILGLFPYAVVPAAIIGLILAIFAFGSGAITRKQASLTAMVVSLAGVAGVFFYNRKLLPVDLVKDPIESGVYIVIGAVLATLLIRGLLRLFGAIAN